MSNGHLPLPSHSLCGSQGSGVGSARECEPLQELQPDQALVHDVGEVLVVPEHHRTLRRECHDLVEQVPSADVDPRSCLRPVPVEWGEGGSFPTGRGCRRRVPTVYPRVPSLHLCIHDHVGRHVSPTSVPVPLCDGPWSTGTGRESRAGVLLSHGRRVSHSNDDDGPDGPALPPVLPPTEKGTNKSDLKMMYEFKRIFSSESVSTQKRTLWVVEPFDSVLLVKSGPQSPM